MGDRAACRDHEARGHLRRSEDARRRLRPSDAALAWRLVRDEPRSGARNMALDHALATCLADGEGVVRLYGWTRPTVSFGRNEPAAGLYSVDAAETDGIDFVRRPTGGRAVLHDRELTYAVVAPLRRVGRREGRVRGDQRSSRRSAAGARGPGGSGRRAARRCGRTRARAFRRPAVGEVDAWGRKLVGSAQARLEGALLQHGSILLSGDRPGCSASRAASRAQRARRRSRPWWGLA